MSGYENLGMMRRKCPVIAHKDRYGDFIAAMRATKVRIEKRHVHLTFLRGKLRQDLCIPLIEIDSFKGPLKDLARVFRRRWLTIDSTEPDIFK